MPPCFKALVVQLTLVVAALSSSAAAQEVRHKEATDEVLFYDGKTVVVVEPKAVLERSRGPLSVPIGTVFQITGVPSTERFDVAWWMPETVEGVIRRSDVKLMMDGLRQLERATQTGSAVAFMNLGRANKALLLLEKADSAISEAIRRSPTSADYFASRGECRLWAGEYDAAVKDLTEALKRNPSACHVLKNRGVARFHNTAYREAINDFDRELEKCGQSFRVFSNRGMNWFALGEFSKAGVDFEKALKLATNVAKQSYSEAAVGHFRRGRWHAESGRYNKALADFDAALAIDARLHVAHRERSHVLLALGRSEDANDAKDAFYFGITLGQGYKRPKYRGLVEPFLIDIADIDARFPGRSQPLRQR
jgi:lipoprotein NlpI